MTAKPTASWLGQQVVNAFPFDTAPSFMIRDRDSAYGKELCRRVDDLGIRSIRTTVRAPKMNCYAERLIGTIRRELFDHVFVLSERHARRLLQEFHLWYNDDRPHLALEKDSPRHRPIEGPEMSEVVSLPGLGGLHHQYSRRAARSPVLAVTPAAPRPRGTAQTQKTRLPPRRRPSDPGRRAFRRPSFTHSRLSSLGPVFRLSPVLRFWRPTAEDLLAYCFRDDAKMGPTLLLQRCRGTVQDGAKGGNSMGDKGGKKDKEKGQKQSSAKQLQKDKAKQDKQPKRKIG